MAEIGSLVVDMALKSAEFIRELDKTSKRVEQSTKAMTASVKVIEKAFGAFVTVRTLRAVSNLTRESLELAAAMHGPLADSARKFLTNFEELQDAFKVGLAGGFLESVTDAFTATEEGMREAQATGKEFGRVLGKIAVDLKAFFGADLPEAIKTTLFQFTELKRVWMDLQQLFSGDLSVITGGISDHVKNVFGPDSAADILAYGDAVELARMETESFWSATVTTTAAGEAWLNQINAQTDVLTNAAGPMHEYELALERIERLHLEGQAATIAHQQAVANLVGNYLQLADNVGTALGVVFKDSKAVAIAQAVINTAQAVMKTFAEYGATPWGFALAASMAAIGAAQIAAIVSSQPGGGSKAVKKSAGGGAKSAPAAAGAASTTSTVPGQAVNITLVGEGGFNREQVRALIAQINSAVGDGATLRVSG